jgi:hypothetical protein
VVLAADLGQIARQQRLVHTQVGRLARDVRRLGASGARELADAVDGVVVVEGEQEAISRTERIGLADESQRARRIRREDGDVFVGGGPKELEHRVAGPLDERRHRRRGRIE